MAASVFVGRVGGLAVALGVGAAVFSTSYGIALADAGSQSGSATQSDSGSASKPSSSVRGARKAPQAAAAKQARNARAAAAAPAADVAIEPAVELADPVADVAAPAEDTTPVDVAPDVAPDVVAYSAAPEPVAAGSGPTRRANATAASGLAANPQYQFFDGVVQGNFNVTSESGCGQLGNSCTLTYEFVESSAGGKANLWSSTNTPVPVTLDPLLQDGRKGGAGSFTFLPYATWIDPENPTTTPIPTGSQSFTVKIRENTKLDQTLSSIPLFGSINEKVIHTFQDLGWLTGLLGASLLSTVNVDVNLTALGRQIAYTYTVSSFDGTPISMNYFPASGTSLLPNPDQAGYGQQATIFNGPGLGSPGETKPYEAFQAAGSVPGLGLMRGQGLPAPFNAIPLGFNVITWDPRGEWDSGGVLQLDNPFYEGRDVSALIDWSLANTPTLLEDVPALDPDSDPIATNVPAIAMMGGSYGGGIQMTTVDPRIKGIVPSIAWNSLNESLYPNSIFKTGWANTLAGALLLTGASSVNRINSQITQALITGNLFGYISDSAQAVLASSGPTTLLSKLNAPVLFNQGTVDALFPLQQAVENAQTLLETNPYFNGTIPGPYPNPAWGLAGGLPKMIWFCGGHGVCTTQTLAQQTAQATAMFLEDMVWVNTYAKEYLKDYPIDPPIVLPGLGPVDNTNIVFQVVLPVIMKTFQWWDQTGTALASAYNVWTDEFQNGTPVVAGNLAGGTINSFTSRTGPLTEQDAAGAVCTNISQACEFPLNQVFATEANNAVNVDITVIGAPGSAKYVVGQPLVSFTYSGRGNAKAVYAQIVDNASGQVLGNINTPIPVTLNGREQTVVDFPIANIAYTAPVTDGSLTLQLVAKSSLYKNNDVIWSVNISDISVTLPTTTTAIANPIVALLPS